MIRRGLTFWTELTGLLVGLLVAGGFGVMTVAVQGLRDAARSELHSQQVLVAIDDLERTTIDLQSGLRGYAVTSQRSFLVPYDAAVRAYPGMTSRLRDMVGTPRDRARVTAIGGAIDSFVRDWGRPLIRQVQAGQAGAARQRIATGAGVRRISYLRAQFAALRATETVYATAEISRAERLGTLAFWLGIGLMIASLLAVLSATAGAHAWLAVPLRRLVRAMERLASGDLSVRARFPGRVEVGALIRGFNEMATRLQQGQAELVANQSELESERVKLERALGSAQERRLVIERRQRFGAGLAEAAASVAAVSEFSLREIADAGRADVGALCLFDEAIGAYVPAATRGLTESATELTVRAGNGLAGRALAERRPVLAERGETSLRVTGLAGDSLARYELHLPLIHGERTEGVLSLARGDGEPFWPAELATLRELAGQAAVTCSAALSARRVERAAHELQALVAATGEGIYATDGNGRITLVNDAALTMTGYARDELTGRGSHDLLHHSRTDGGAYPQAECPITRVLGGGPGVRITDEVFWRKDGTSFPVEYGIYPLIEDRRVTGAVISFTDISERKLAERLRDLRHQVTKMMAESGEELWSRALAATCEGLRLEVGITWVAASQGTRLRMVNAHAMPGFGDAAARLRRGPLKPGEGPAGLALSRGERVVVRDLSREQPRPGRVTDPRLRSAIAVPAFGHEGRVLAVAEFFSQRDLADPDLMDTLNSLAGQFGQYLDRLNAEAATRRAREDLIATVSHDLRSPMTSISGWLQLLLAEKPGPLTDDQRKFLNKIKRNSDRLTRMAGDLLFASEIEAGQPALNLSEVDLAEIAREAAELASERAAGKDIKLLADAGEPAVIRGDRVRLSQLMDNLLSNAVKFTPSGGEIRVLVRPGDPCRVEVSDTGIGVPEQERSRLFERFFRASSATAHGITGTGLGLVICKAIAEAHGGRIYLADRPGPGSAFVTELPAAR